MMNAGSDQSETTSLTQYSWTTTPKRSVALYYVQSPSRDSHDGDKSSNQGGTGTPRSLDSPLESRSSSASRVSGPGRLKGSLARGLHGSRWRVIEEEEDEGGSRREDPMRRSHVCWVWLGAFLCIFCLVMWAATRPFKPHVSLQKLIVHDFYTGQGLDWGGVPTKMLTVNCSLQMRVQNPATFFGIHVSSTIFNLLYYDLTIASGKMEEFYQARKTWRDVSVNIQGNELPLYGASTGFATFHGKRRVPLKLDFELKTKGDVVGKLVRSKHTLQVSCSFTISNNNPKSVGFLENSCKYH